MKDYLRVKDYLTFLVHEKVWWITPIVIFLLLLVLLAWFEARVPENPFTYDL